MGKSVSKSRKTAKKDSFNELLEKSQIIMKSHGLVKIMHCGGDWFTRQDLALERQRQCGGKIHLFRIGSEEIIEVKL